MVSVHFSSFPEAAWGHEPLDEPPSTAFVAASTQAVFPRNWRALVPVVRCPGALYIRFVVYHGVLLKCPVGNGPVDNGPFDPGALPEPAASSLLQETSFEERCSRGSPGTPVLLLRWLLIQCSRHRPRPKNVATNSCRRCGLAPPALAERAHRWSARHWPTTKENLRRVPQSVSAARSGIHTLSLWRQLSSA